jgi:transposase-like protein
MRERGREVREKWHGLVLQQIDSGQSVAAFCRERGVASSQLFAWKKRLREAEAAQFIEVEVKAPEQAGEAAIRQANKGIEVRLCRGRSVVVEPGFDADHLRALLGVLESEA